MVPTNEVFNHDPLFAGCRIFSAVRSMKNAAPTEKVRKFFQILKNNAWGAGKIAIGLVLT
jgi:hypothetical protein